MMHFENFQTHVNQHIKPILQCNRSRLDNNRLYICFVMNFLTSHSHVSGRKNGGILSLVIIYLTIQKNASNMIEKNKSQNIQTHDPNWDYDQLLSANRSPTKVIDHITVCLPNKRFNIIRTEQPDVGSKPAIDLFIPEETSNLVTITQTRKEDRQQCQFFSYTDQERQDKLRFSNLKKEVQEQLQSKSKLIYEETSGYDSIIILGLSQLFFTIYPCLECFIIFCIVIGRLVIITFQQLKIVSEQEQGSLNSIILILSLIIQAIYIALRYTHETQKILGLNPLFINLNFLIEFSGTLIDALLLTNLLQNLTILYILWILTAMNTLRITRNVLILLDYLLKRVYQLTLIYLVDYYTLILILSLLSAIPDLERLNNKRYLQLLNIVNLFGFSLPNQPKTYISSPDDAQTYSFFCYAYSSMILYCFQLVSVIRIFLRSKSNKLKKKTKQDDLNDFDALKCLKAFIRFQLKRLKQIYNPYEISQLTSKILYFKKFQILQSLPDISNLFTKQFLGEMAQIGKFQRSKQNWNISNFNRDNNLIVILTQNAQIQTQLSKKFWLSDHIQGYILLGSQGFFDGSIDGRNFSIEGNAQFLTIDYGQFQDILSRYPIEKEKYHLLRHNLIFNNHHISGFNCSACEQQHLTNKCPLISYNPQKLQILRNHIFSIPNQRCKIDRKFVKSSRTLSKLQIVQMAHSEYQKKINTAEDKIRGQVQSDSSFDDQFLYSNEIQQLSPKNKLDDSGEDIQISRISQPSTAKIQSMIQTQKQRKSMPQLPFLGQKEIEQKEPFNKIQLFRSNPRSSQLPTVFEEEDIQMNQSLEPISPIKARSRLIDNFSDVEGEKFFPPILSISNRQSLQRFNSFDISQKPWINAQDFIQFEEDETRASLDTDSAKDYTIFFPQDNLSNMLKRLNAD